MAHLEGVLEHNRWLKTTEEPALDPGRPIVDAHHHLWVDHASRLHTSTYTTDEMESDIHGHNIIASVYMQSKTAGWGGSGPLTTARCRAEGAAVCAFAKKSKSRNKGRLLCKACILSFPEPVDSVGRIPETVTEIAAAGGDGFRGVRMYGGRAEELAFESPVFHAVLDELESRDLIWEVNGPETHPLDWQVVSAVAKAAAAHPNLKVVLNHLGGAVGPRAFPNNDSGRLAKQEWEKVIESAAATPNIFCKIGGMVMETNGHGFELNPTAPSSEAVASAIRPYVEVILKHFGPHRCMFESNFPVDRCSVSYRNLWNAFKRCASILQLSEEDKSALFCDTARKVYRI